ncbi:glycosyltransferase (plasmid) [Streptomyces sp. BI20]|uniref:glycosyltransferase n=1 Tax=Streptomyces sp. BI20 TaxID=3403460 RepID=UPI003C77235F
MRVLVTTLGSPSHGRAQLPLARALAAAGHEVLAATTPPVAGVFAQDPVRVLPCLPDTVPGDTETARFAELAARADLDDRAREEAVFGVLAEALSGPMARAALARLAPVFEEFRPDLLLRDGMDLAGVVLAERHGLPQLPTPSGAGNVMDPATLLPGLNSLRADEGLPVHADPLSLVPHGRIDCVPAAYTFARHLPAALAYQQTVTVDRNASLPAWTTDLPTDRPLVLAAMGTALPLFLAKFTDPERPMPYPMPDPVATLRAVVEAAALLHECTVIVATLGLPLDPALRAALPPHVHVVERVPQPLLLECVDLFLTHGGFNGIREALRTATPMAVLPQFGDQHDNARRITELGLGRHLRDTTPDAIAAGCRAVLADPECAARARRARLAMLTLPEIGAAVTDLEHLAAGHAAPVPHP